MADGPRHLTARIDGEGLVEVGPLERLCQKDKSRPEAARVIRAGREGRLKSTRCGSLLICKFGERKAWHLARRPGQPPCAHGDESEEHQEAVVAVRDALARTHPGWRLESEWHLRRRDRVVDVLAYNGGTGVAVELQRSSLTRGDWRARRDDYSESGLTRDYWFAVVGGSLAPPPKGGTPLSRMFAEEADQRVVYVAVLLAEDGRGRPRIRAYEMCYVYWAPHDVPGVRSLPLKCRSRGEIPQGAFGERTEWREIRLDSLRLDAEGNLTTGLDAFLAGYARWRSGKAEERLREEREHREREAAEQERRERERREAALREQARRERERRERPGSAPPRPDARVGANASSGRWARVLRWLRGT